MAPWMRYPQCPLLWQTLSRGRRRHNPKLCEGRGFLCVFLVPSLGDLFFPSPPGVHASFSFARWQRKQPQQQPQPQQQQPQQPQQQQQQQQQPPTTTANNNQQQPTTANTATATATAAAATAATAAATATELQQNSNSNSISNSSHNHNHNHNHNHSWFGQCALPCGVAFLLDWCRCSDCLWLNIRRMPCPSVDTQGPPGGGESDDSDSGFGTNV